MLLLLFKRDILLIVESAEQSDTTLDPVGLSFVAGQLDAEHKVGRVTGGRESAGARERLVDGTHVDAARGLRAVHGGHEPNDGHLGEELFGARLVQLVGARVPASALDEQAAYVAAVIGRAFYLSLALRQYL